MATVNAPSCRAMSATTAAPPPPVPPAIPACKAGSDAFKRQVFEGHHAVKLVQQGCQHLCAFLCANTVVGAVLLSSSHSWRRSSKVCQAAAAVSALHAQGTQCATNCAAAGFPSYTTHQQKHQVCPLQSPVYVVTALQCSCLHSTRFNRGVCRPVAGRPSVCSQLSMSQQRRQHREAVWQATCRAS